MKKYGLVAGLAVILIAGVLVWRWLVRSNDDMASSLPQGVTMVARIDARQAMSEYGISWAELTQLLLSDKESTGIDPMKVGYLFAWNNYLGAILPLKNADDFEQYLLRHSHTTQEQRGIRWSVIDGRQIVGYTDDRAILMGPALGTELDNLRNTIAQCLQQKETNSGTQERLFKRLQERTEPIALATDLSSLAAIPWVGEKLQPYIDQPLEVSAGLNIKKDKLTLSFALSSDDAKMNKWLDSIDEILKPVNANLLRTSPTHPAFHLEMGMRGESLLSFLRTMPEVRAKLLIVNTIFDADLLLRNIDGDVSVTVPRIELFDTPVPVMQMELRDASFMDNVADWNDEFSQAAGVRFVPTNTQQGWVEMKERKPVYYSLSDHRLVLSESQKLAWATGYHDVEISDAKRMTDCCVYATLNLGNIMLLRGFIDRSQEVRLMSSSVRQWQMEVPTDGLAGIMKLLSM